MYRQTIRLKVMLWTILFAFSSYSIAQNNELDIGSIIELET